jgi:HK97 family phage portal protein
MANFWSRLFNRAQDGDPKQAGGYIGFYPSAFLPADTYLSHDQALSLSAVWGCVQFISQSLACAETKVLEKGPGGKRQDSSGDRVYRLFNLRPNPDTTSKALVSGWVSQALIFGDSYIEIRRDMAARPYELYLLPSAEVSPMRGVDGLMSYEYRPQSGAGIRVISGNDIIHLRGPSLYSFLGESVVTRAARSIAIAKAQDEFALAYYVNSTVLGGVLTRTGTLDAATIKATQENFEAARKGASKAHKALLLPTGVTWTPIETDAQKSQSVEGRQHSVVDICRFFGVPPPLVGDLGRATWANLESLYIQVVRDCLGVWAEEMRQEIEWKCFGDGSTKWIEIDLKPLTRGDAKSRAEANQVLRRNGVINANEWREDEGLDPIGEEGDLYVIEANMTLLDEDALTPPEPVAPAAPNPAAEPPSEDETATDSEESKVSVTVKDMAAFHRFMAKRKAD